ncbi:MAG: hypothetical protein IKK18_05775 [Clostridia bacterium]|nr:hypothetical protein [Clostridia bacterium]
MSLKTSYFNLPLFKSNLRRFWWIGAGVLLAYLTVALLFLFDEDTSEGFAVMNAVVVGVAGILPAILFSYLNNSGSVTCLHALPVKRKAHFLTNLATVYALILVPAIISYAIGFFYCVLEMPIGIGNLADYFVMLIICATIATSAGTLGSMITGNTIAAIFFAILFFAFPFYAEGVLKGFLSTNVFGIWDVEYYSLDNMSILKANPFMIGWFIVSIIGLIVSWFLYKNRKLETNGDIISFDFLKPVFIAAVSVFAGLIGYFYLNVFFDDSIFLMLPFGILGAVVSYMLSKKAFTIKGIWKPILIYIIFVGAVWGTISFDLTGFERRVPDIADIESIDMVDTDSFINRYHYYTIEGKKYYYDMSIEDYRYYDEEDFKNITAFHKQRIEDRKSGFEKIHIVYNLKNGKTLRRIYSASLIEDREYLEPIYKTEQKLKINHGWLVKEYPVTEIVISDDRLKNDSKNFEILVGDSKKAKLLLDALKKDVSEASYEDIVSYRNSLTQVQISYQRDLIDENGNVFIDESKERTTYDNFGIPKSYVRTTALLTEWGLFDAIYKPNEISCVELEFDYRQEETVRFKNPDEIKEIYDFVSEAKLIQTKEHGYDFNVRLIFLNAQGKRILDFSGSRQTNIPVPRLLSAEINKYKFKYGQNIPKGAIAETYEIY